jgi:hypothetical protein
MINSNRLAYGERKLSDAVLDGLFGGLAGGIAMAIYLVLWGLLAGRGPAAVLGLFDPALRGAAPAGALTHLAVAAVYGILFGLAWWVLGRMLPGANPAWLAGALYGLALLAVAKLVVLPAGGSALAEIPTLHFAVAHLLYGAVLGLLAEHMAGRAA